MKQGKQIIQFGGFHMGVMGVMGVMGILDVVELVRQVRQQMWEECNDGNA